MKSSREENASLAGLLLDENGNRVRKPMSNLQAECLHHPNSAEKATMRRRPWPNHSGWIMIHKWLLQPGEMECRYKRGKQQDPVT